MRSKVCTGDHIIPAAPCVTVVRCAIEILGFNFELSHLFNWPEARLCDSLAHFLFVGCFVVICIHFNSCCYRTSRY